jgi:large subunit ribosomal protein L15
MMKLNEVRPAKGAIRKRKRRGRGTGSGLGKTAGKGHKGQQARSGATKGKSFEGGQMKLTRRIPKFGFTNPSRVEYQAINVRTLQERFEDGDTVNPATLAERGLLHKKHEPVKLLGDGDLTKRLTVHVDAISGTARQKVESAGGSVQVETRSARQKRAAATGGPTEGTQEDISET